MTWEKSDNARLREYFRKSDGKLLGCLKSRLPRIDGTSIETVALQAKFKEGFESALREIDDLAAPPETEEDPSSGTYTTM